MSNESLAAFGTAGGEARQIQGAELIDWLKEQEKASIGEKYETGRAIETGMIRHHNPETVRYLSHLYMLSLESDKTGGEIVSDWTVAMVAGQLNDRSMALKLSHKDLQDLELVENFDPKRLIGDPVVGGFGLREIFIERAHEQSYELDKDGNKVNPRWIKIKEPKTYYGTEQERAKLADVFTEMRDMTLIRFLILRNKKFYLAQRENLRGLVQLYFGPFPTATAEKMLFNAKAIKGQKLETLAEKELRSFGHMIAIAMRLYYLNALCEKVEEFRFLTKTPGFKEVFPEGVSGSVVEEWIGKPDKWTYEPANNLGSVRSKETLLEENKNGERGYLTKRNIFAESDPIGDAELHKKIQEFIAGKDPNKADLIAAEAAQNLAYWQFKLWLLADRVGYEWYRNDSIEDRWNKKYKGKELVMENGPAASDFGKVIYPAWYLLKNYRKEGRDFGPPGSFGSHPVLCVSFPESVYMSVELGKKVKMLDDTESNKTRLTMLEAWWGYPEDGNFPEIPATELDEMPWETFGEEILAAVYLPAYMAGKEEGTYDMQRSTSFKFDELATLKFWTDLWKNIDVGIKEGVVFNGRLKGVSKEMETEQKRRYKRNVVEWFWYGLSTLECYAEWHQKVMTQKDKLTSIGEDINCIDFIRATAKQALGFELPHYEPTFRPKKGTLKNLG